jgi:hypothetical protein
MRRTILVLVVAALMVMAPMAGPAFAQGLTPDWSSSPTAGQSAQLDFQPPYQTSPIGQQIPFGGAAERTGNFVCHLELLGYPCQW